MLVCTCDDFMVHRVKAIGSQWFRCAAMMINLIWREACLFIKIQMLQMNTNWSIGPVSYSPKFTSEDDNKSVLKNKESTFHKILYKQVV